MTSVFAEASSGSGGLQMAGIFEFSQARSVILDTLGQPADVEAQRGFELLQLTSAELSLLPVYLMPQTLSLPLTQPMPVPGWAALASVVKGSCSLNRPYHHDKANLTTFVGDQQKLQARDTGQHFLQGYSEEPDWNYLADDLQDQHRSSNTAIGHAIANSGVIRLQTMIWAAKWTAFVPDSQVDFGGLAHSLGIVS